MPASGGMAELSADEQEFSDALRNDEAAFDVLEEPIESSGLLPLPLEYSYAEPAQPAAIADEADVRRQLGRQWDTVEDMKACVAACTRARGWSIILDVKGRRALCSNALRLVHFVVCSVICLRAIIVLSFAASIQRLLLMRVLPAEKQDQRLLQAAQQAAAPCRQRAAVHLQRHPRMWMAHMVGTEQYQYNLGDVATLYSRPTAPHLNHHMQLETSGRDVEVARSISDIPTEAFSFLAQWVKACMPASTLRKVNTLTRRHHTQSCMILFVGSNVIPLSHRHLCPFLRRL
jgi:hypothetical protein